jgi:hypothetical protein
MFRRMVGHVLGLAIGVCERMEGGHMGTAQPRSDWPLAQQDLAPYAHKEYGTCFVVTKE